MPPRIVAELRDWEQMKTERPTFQGRVMNDVRHRYADGYFLTVDAHDIQDNGSGLLVTHTEGEIYVLWNAFKRGKPNED